MKAIYKSARGKKKDWVVTDKEICDYLIEKEYGNKTRAITFAVMGMSVLVMIARTIQLGTDRVTDPVLGISALFLVVSFSYFMTSNTYTITFGSREHFGLLKKWEYATGRPLTEFPTSADLVAGLRDWAEQEIITRARVVKELFAEQRVVQVAYAELRKRQVSPPQIPKHKLEIARAISHVNAINKSVGHAHERFLGFWDLVTEESGGIGILSGLEWRFPHAFLQELNKEKAPAESPGAEQALTTAPVTP